MVLTYVALGANLGDAQATVRWAMAQLGALAHSRLSQCSSLYKSAPVDASGPDYVNAVVALETDLIAPVLLQQLHRIESLAGRERPYPNAPRTLDLDLLLYGEASVHSPQLTLPHPRMHQRAFVLVPLAEIAPHRVDPVQLTALQSQRLHRLPG